MNRGVVHLKLPKLIILRYEISPKQKHIRQNSNKHSRYFYLLCFEIFIQYIMLFIYNILLLYNIVLISFCVMMTCNSCCREVNINNLMYIHKLQ